MLNCASILYIKDNEYLKYNNKSCMFEQICLNDVESIKNRRIVIIIETGDVLIKEITIPYVGNNYIYNMIYNELMYEFGEMENILFDYSVVNRGEKELDAIVYCLRWDNNKNVITNISKRNKVIKLYNLPMMIINNMKITQSEFVLMFKNDKRIYLMAYSDNNLIGFYGFRYCNDKDFYNDLLFFISELLDKKYEKCKDSLYILNFHENELILKDIKKYRCYNLGLISYEKIIGFK